jgi:hypothetical protein
MVGLILWSDESGYKASNLLSRDNWTFSGVTAPRPTHRIRPAPLFSTFPPIASLWVQLDSNVPTCSLASFALPGAPKLHSCGTLHTSCFELGSHPFNNSMFNVQPRSVFLSPALPFPLSISWFSSPNRLQFSIAEPVVPREIGRARASRGQCVSK